ncbi:MAG TPA: hypothetical protein VN700_03120 [Vicinamibacterales bacterium]|nr:hypothetical protein [Vicinamibacterales bacterium]
MPKNSIDLSHIAVANVVRVSGRLSETTPITGMGINSNAAAALTPKAAKLTKADLTALSGPNAKLVAAGLGLKASDLASIRSAFSGVVSFGAVGAANSAGLSVSCCCCTPCCCAAAALQPTARAN